MTPPDMPEFGRVSLIDASAFEAGRSPWPNPREHRDRRGAVPARRDEGAVAALPARGATQSGASEKQNVYCTLHNVMLALQCEPAKRSGPARMHRRADARRDWPRAARAYVSARLPLLDDFRPHVGRTEDYGETWTRIVDGIRDDAYVNSVREDPNREGLLYAGTNHGVYVTFDDGGWWQELNPGLPDMPVTDVIPEHDELAMASHGRGFRVLDNVGRAGSGSRGARACQRRRRGSGVVRASGGVPVGGRSGAVVAGGGGGWECGGGDAGGVRRDRSGGPHLQACERRGGTGPVERAGAPVGTGLKRVRWDLRTDPATVDRANWAVIEIRRVKGALEERLEGVKDEGLRKAAERLRVALEEIKGKIYQVRNRSTQGPLNFPINVNNRPANLLSMLEQGGRAAWERNSTEERTLQLGPTLEMTLANSRFDHTVIPLQHMEN